jgi:hypothetical protein
MRIGSSATLLICVTALFVGYIWTTFFPAAQYGVFAPSLVALAGAYFTKRVVQKSEKFGGAPCADIKKIGDIHGQD